MEEYGYYFYHSTVIRLKKPHNYRDVVHAMRAKVNQNTFSPINMMIESIHVCTEREYNEFCELNSKRE